MPKGDNNRKLSDDDLLEIRRIYTTRNADGTWTGVTTIARKFGVANFTIQTRLANMGVEMRSRKESHSGGKRCAPGEKIKAERAKRIADHGPPPKCACGCGETVAWNTAKTSWYKKVQGHRMPKPEPKPRWRYGPDNNAWKGGVTPLRQRLYKTSEWRETVKSTLARDGYRCQRCGSGKVDGKKLHSHHIAPFADNPALRFDVDNLVTLCGECHRWVHSRGNVLRDFLAA